MCNIILYDAVFGFKLFVATRCTSVCHYIICYGCANSVMFIGSSDGWVPRLQGNDGCGNDGCGNGAGTGFILAGTGGDGCDGLDPCSSLVQNMKLHYWSFPRRSYGPGYCCLTEWCLVFCTQVQENAVRSHKCIREQLRSNTSSCSNNIFVVKVTFIDLPPESTHSGHIMGEVCDS